VSEWRNVESPPRRGPLQRKAYAKVNPFLRVLGKRADGYHDIESLILPVTLADVLTFRKGVGGVRVRVTKGGAGLPREEDNLIHAAASTLAGRRGVARSAVIQLVKRIPIAAGLGGGSADAAATLLGLNELWGCGLGLEELMEVGAAIGSDVPALVRGGAVMVRGRGETAEGYQTGTTWWVIVPQPFPVSTRDAYGWWDEEGSTGPDPAPLLEAAQAGRLDELAELLFNDLESVVARRHPQVEEAKRALTLAGALGAVMSGSGPTVAGLARDEPHARQVAATVPEAMPVAAPP
jgi:4-diphosphocytidyl-2-C-methyl-D-erythritol kinase